MRRRIGVVFLSLVAVLYVATDSVSACRFLDGLFSRSRRCCAPCRRVPRCTAKPTCCMPAACDPVVGDPVTCGSRHR